MLMINHSICNYALFVITITVTKLHDKKIMSGIYSIFFYEKVQNKQEIAHLNRSI